MKWNALFITVLSAHLFKIAVKFLTFSNNDESVADLYVVTKIRKYLSTTKTEESVKSFDVLYAKLQSMVSEESVYRKKLIVTSTECNSK